MTLIDTSAWVEALRRSGLPQFKERVREIMLAGQAAICEMVVLELWNGARGEEEKRSLRLILEQLKLLPISSEVWEASYELARNLRVRGITIPAQDVLIAATARYYDAELYHNDSHFALIPSDFGPPSAKS